MKERTKRKVTTKRSYKEVDENKMDFSTGIVKAIVVFGKTKTIINSGKDFYHCIKSFRLSMEASASSGKNRDIMVQISIDTCNNKGILFASSIVNMPCVPDWLYPIEKVSEARDLPF